MGKKNYSVSTFFQFYRDLNRDLKNNKEVLISEKRIEDINTKTQIAYEEYR